MLSYGHFQFGHFDYKQLDRHRKPHRIIWDAAAVPKLQQTSDLTSARAVLSPQIDFIDHDGINFWEFSLISEEKGVKYPSLKTNTPHHYITLL